MIDISENELFRRLKLIRDIRENFVKKYNIPQDEIKRNYNMLKWLDEAEYIEVQHKGNIQSIRYGKYEKEQTITNYDPIKGALYNRGEVAGYWGDSFTISGNFKKELGYIYVCDEFFNSDFDDDKISKTEQKEFADFIHHVRYHLNSDLEYKKKKLCELETEIENINRRLNELADIYNEIAEGR